MVEVQLRRFAVEVQKLRTFDEFKHARATLCGDSRGRGSKTGDFLLRARPSAEIRVVEVQKLMILTIFSMRARPSAEIREDFLRF